jgi:hypothetical protein
MQVDESYLSNSRKRKRNFCDNKYCRKRKFENNIDMNNIIHKFQKIDIHNNKNRIYYDINNINNIDNIDNIDNNIDNIDNINNIDNLDNLDNISKVKKQKIYNCSLHDDTKEICLIYNCSGNTQINENLNYNYIK